MRIPEVVSNGTECTTKFRVSASETASAFSPVMCRLIKRWKRCGSRFANPANQSRTSLPRASRVSLSSESSNKASRAAVGRKKSVLPTTRTKYAQSGSRSVTFLLSNILRRYNWCRADRPGCAPSDSTNATPLNPATGTSSGITSKGSKPKFSRHQRRCALLFASHTGSLPWP